MSSAKLAAKGGRDKVKESPGGCCNERFPFEMHA